MILVIGANGNIGRSAVRHLVAAGVRTRALVREPSRAETHGGKVELARGDLGDPSSLAAAFTDVAKVLVVAPGPDVVAQEAAAVRAAQAARVDEIVLVSSLGVDCGGVAGGPLHLPGEKLLVESGLSWTVLRPSEFMTNARWWAATIRASGAVYAPTGEGQVGFIDPEDIGAVAARVLTTPGHDRAIYRLTGPEALSTADVAACIAAAIGSPVTHVDVSEDAFRTSAREAGMPAFQIEMLATYYAAVKEGRVAMITDDVPSLLGRPARRFAQWARENAAVFR